MFEEENIRTWKSEMLQGGCAFVNINELIKSTKKTSKILCVFQKNHCSDYLSNHLICNAFENDYDDGIYLNGLLKTSENFQLKKVKEKVQEKVKCLIMKKSEHGKVKCF